MSFFFDLIIFIILLIKLTFQILPNPFKKKIIKSKYRSTNWQSIPEGYEQEYPIVRRIRFSDLEYILIVKLLRRYPQGRFIKTRKKLSDYIYEMF